MSSLNLHQFCRKGLHLIFMLLSLSCTQIHAYSKFISLDAFAGYASISTESEAPTPRLAQSGGGLSVAIGTNNIKRRILLGASSDYRWINQYSSDDLGNAKGSRWNRLSPFVGVQLNRFIFKADYQFWGPYKQVAKGLENESLSYVKPRGWRFQSAVEYKNRFLLGLFYESVKFSHIKLGVAEVELGTPLNLWQTGAVFGIKFN